MEKATRADLKRRVEFIIQKVTGVQYPFALFLLTDKGTTYLSNVQEADTSAVMKCIAEIVVAYENGKQKVEALPPPPAEKK